MVVGVSRVEILLVEDDITLGMGIEYTLKSEGYNVSLAGSKKQALEKIEVKEFDLYIVDITLPDGNGFDICEKIREQNNSPIIFLTAEDDEVNVVKAFDLGADDYISKPFRVKEFISRIKAIFRRSGKEIRETIKTGNLEIDYLSNRVMKKGELINLTPAEYKLLVLLVENKKQVLTRNVIIEKLWDIEGSFIDDNTLSVYVKRLRHKIEDDPKKSRYIKTVRGVGYIWNEEVL